MVRTTRKDVDEMVAKALSKKKVAKAKRPSAIKRLASRFAPAIGALDETISDMSDVLREADVLVDNVRLRAVRDRAEKLRQQAMDWRDRAMKAPASEYAVVLAKVERANRYVGWVQGVAGMFPAGIVRVARSREINADSWSTFEWVVPQLEQI